MEHVETFRGSGLSGKKVLVVDDDADWRDYLRLSLEELGYETLLASSGSEALESIANEEFSVILLDLNMPGMRGEEVVSRLPSRHPRVVFLTSSAAEDVRGVLRTGPHYYLPKGASQQELALLLQSLEA